MAIMADPDWRRVLLPAEALAAGLIVCERSGRWAAGLRRELAAEGVRLYETRSLGDCWRRLAQAPASFVVVELRAAVAEQLVEQMASRAREFPLAGLAVVADRDLAGYEWLMREAGAIHFVCSPRRLGPLGRLVCRHLARAPHPRQSLTDRIWNSLPWKRSDEGATTRDRHRKPQENA